MIEDITRRDFFKSAALGTASLTLYRFAWARPEQEAISTPEGYGRKRARELGIVIGTMPRGEFNAITDVEGVKVGHSTIHEGDVRTGVTAVIPHSDDIFRYNLFAGYLTLNGNGEMTGMSRIRRTGLLGSFVFTTNTSSVGMVYDAALKYFMEKYQGTRIPSPVVAETWDGFLNDIEGRHVEEEHVLGAINSAQSGRVGEGCVGGGTGMVCYGFKGGIGTASRVIKEGYTAGVLVQANHGRRHQLIIDGAPVGREITDLKAERGVGHKSIIVVVATDAPLLPVQLNRLTKRAALGLSRTGATSMHSSGDIILAFSTGNIVDVYNRSEAYEFEVLNDEAITPLYQAVVEATEESVINALTMAHTTVGRHGNTVYALPLDRVVKIMKRHGKIK